MRSQVRLLMSYFLHQCPYVPIDTLQGSFLVTSFKIIIDRQNRASVLSGALAAHLSIDIHCA